MTSVDNNTGLSVNCNWYSYPDNVLLASNTSTYTFTVPDNAPYGTPTVKADYVGDSAVVDVKPYHIYPAVYRILPISANVSVGDSVSFVTVDGYGDPVSSHWYLNGELIHPIDIENPSTHVIEFTSAGVYTVTVECSANDNVTTTATITVTDSGTEEPEPSPEPSGDWVTIPDMNASQSTQTNTILSAITEAVQEIKTAVQNDSRIYDLFTQSFVYHNFDFNTGKLSTQGVTLNGFVPTFNHFAQNVEEYLGMLVDVRASEDEEEVKSETKGFWSILSGLFKADENTGKAEANTDDMNSIMGIGNDMQTYFNAGGSIGDLATIINSDDTWSWFSDEISSEIDSAPSTFSREPRVDYRSIVYRDFYENVLGREWSD